MDKGFTVWMTGLPAAGKTTIGTLIADKFNAQLLDGDNLRNSYISGDADFSREGRRKHLLKVAEIAKLLNDNGIPVVVSCISPFGSVRDEARKIIGVEQFTLVFVDTPKELCEIRDPKGMWAKARNGKIKNFTGVDSEYEIPTNADFTLTTYDINQSNGDIIEYENANIYTTVALLEDHIRTKFKLTQHPRTVFIGRWSPFHYGHKALIDKHIDNGEYIAIFIRDTKVDANNPWLATDRYEMIRSVYPDQEVVQIQIIPDVSAIAIGRNVGYDVIAEDLPDDIEMISGTEIRKAIREGRDIWKKYVPEEVISYISSKRNI